MPSAFMGDLTVRDLTTMGLGGGITALISSGIYSSYATPENDYRWGRRDASGEIPFWMDYRFAIMVAGPALGAIGLTYRLPMAVNALLGSLGVGATFSLVDSEFRRWSESGQLLGMDVPDFLPEWGTPAAAANGNGNGAAAPELAVVNGG